MKSPIVLLLTATIDPGDGARHVVRADPNVRLADYLAALRFWLTYPDQRIAGVVFCDNSGADLSAVREMAAQSRRPLEVLGFSGNHLPGDMHYGYAELGTIDYALQHSRLLATAKHLAKITGRLTFPRFSRLLDASPEPLDALVDCRAAYRGEGGPPLRARTQLMLFSRQFYAATLANRRHEMIGQCTHIEEFFAAKLGPLKGRPGIVLRSKVEIQPSGVQASNGVPYGTIADRGKAAVRAALRKVAPGIWL